jgi:hypothetical protein
MNQKSAARLFDDLLLAIRVLEPEGPAILCPVALRVLETEGSSILGPEATAEYRRILLQRIAELNDRTPQQQPRCESLPPVTAITRSFETPCENSH